MSPEAYRAVRAVLTARAFVRRMEARFEDTARHAIDFRGDHLNAVFALSAAQERLAEAHAELARVTLAEYGINDDSDDDTETLLRLSVVAMGRG